MFVVSVIILSNLTSYSY